MDVVLDHGAAGRGDRVQSAGVVAATREPEVPSLPATKGREDPKRALDVRGHLLGGQSGQVVTVGGEGEVGVGVASSKLGSAAILRVRSG
jgi:hypothetical protein